MPLCLLCLDFLLCKQQKTTNNLPCVHLFYGESLKMMQYMVCGMVLWGCRDFCSLLWVSPYKRILPYRLTRKALETNCIYPLLLFQCNRGDTPSCSSRLCLNPFHPALSFEVVHSMSLLVISMLFISEYKKVTNYKLASQTISGSFKATCAVHYSYQEQPEWSKEKLEKVCSSPGAERCSEGTARALLSIHPVQIQRGSLRQDGVWSFSTSWRNCGSDMHDYGDCESLTQSLEQGKLHGALTGPHRQWLWGKFQSRGEQPLSLHWLRDLQFCKTEI